MARSEMEQHVQAIARNLLPEDREAAARLIDEVLDVNEENRPRQLSALSELSDRIFKAGHSWGCETSKVFDDENQDARLEPDDVDEILEMLDELREFMDQNLPGEGEPTGAAVSNTESL